MRVLSQSRNRIDRRGMTLVEMMVALVLFGVIMGVVFSFLVNSRRSYTSISERVEYQQSARAVLSLVTREIRSAGCDPLEIGFDSYETDTFCDVTLTGPADFVYEGHISL